MNNNFLDNYKKKSEQDISELAKNVEEKAEGQIAPQSTPVNSSPQTTATASKQSIAPKTMNFEQDGFLKPVTGGAPSPNTDDNPIKRYAIPAAIIAGITLVLIIVLVLLLGGGTDAPAMVGKRLSDAELWANENQVLLTSEKEFSDVVPEGEIISQSPVEGEPIESGGFFEIVLSLGPDPEVMVTIPANFEDMTMQEVEQWAEDNLMSAVRITTDESETVPEGEIIEYTINDDTVIGNEIRRDSPLYVTFSKGEGEGEPVKLPNFLTMSLEEAEDFAEENGIVLIKNEVFHDTVAKGMIIKQSIKAEEIVKVGDEITLDVSKGREIIVPNFFSYDRERASMVASSEGITTLVKELYSTLDEDKLISQSMSAGSLYEEGDIVELCYSLGNTFVLPSFVGSNETAIREWVTPKNELGASISVSTRYTASDKPAGTVLSQTAHDITIGINYTLNIVVSDGGIIYAPDLVDESGLAPVTREMALQICSDLGIVPVFTERAHGTKFWPGEVWAQNISPGTEMKPGAVIELTVNPLDSGVKIADFTDMTEAEARAAANSLTVKITVGDYVAGKAGLVVKQSLTAGTMAAPGTVIELTVGSPLKMPDYSDYTEALVRASSQFNDLNVTFDYGGGSTTGPSNYVVSAQSIPSGTEVSKGASVTLTMAAPSP